MTRETPLHKKRNQYKMLTILPKKTLWAVICLWLAFSCTPEKKPLSDRPIAVLTFDDAVKSHRTFVAPLLKEYGFNASFFVTYAWMDDTTHFMNWHDIADLSNMGFEIGNHSWTHANFSQPRQAFELEGELGMMEWQLIRSEVPKPISYAHTGNAFGPEAIQSLVNLGYQFARRGKQPEIEYGSLAGGIGYDPNRHHPLLIPTTVDFYPGMTLELFAKALDNIPPHEIAVLQFHGIPDIAHPWVSTPEQDFRQYLDHLKKHNYQVIALKEVESFIPDPWPDDPLVNTRYPQVAKEELKWPQEVVQSREHTEVWLPIMQRHRFTTQEIGSVLGMSSQEIDGLLMEFDGDPANDDDRIEVLPFPGGRHPRIDFKEGMLSPRRGTKLSVFLPWDHDDYVVLDIPEAVMTQFGITFLGHKHIPTVFDLQKEQIPNSEWAQKDDGSWENIWHLPNGIEIGANVTSATDQVNMRLWLTNHTIDTIWQDLQTQVCVMLGQAEMFAAQTNNNKQLNCPVAAVHAADKNHWMITGWEGCTHPWGNDDCPCLHADPSFPDCAPGETVSIHGILAFYQGMHPEVAIQKIKAELTL